MENDVIGGCKKHKGQSWLNCPLCAIESFKIENTKSIIGLITTKDIARLTDFRNRRKSSGLKLREVEKLTGISNAYLSQLETGKITNPSFSTVITLHNLYTSLEFKK